MSADPVAEVDGLLPEKGYKDLTSPRTLPPARS